MIINGQRIVYLGLGWDGYKPYIQAYDDRRNYYRIQIHELNKLIGPNTMFKVTQPKKYKYLEVVTDE